MVFRMTVNNETFSNHRTILFGQIEMTQKAIWHTFTVDSSSSAILGLELVISGFRISDQFLNSIKQQMRIEF